MTSNIKRRPKRKEFISKIFIICSDLVLMYIALFISFSIHSLVNSYSIDISSSFSRTNNHFISYAIILSSIFFYGKIYTHRYDFWQEARIIIKSLVLGFFVLIIYNFLILKVEGIHTNTIIFSFFLLAFLTPFSKYFLKTLLFNLGYWKKGVKLLSQNKELKCQLLEDKYLGYIKSKRSEADLVFIDSKSYSKEKFMQLIEQEIISKEKVLFLPIINNYQYSNSDIFEITNTRTNLIVLENKLKSKYRLLINKVSNMVLALLIIPFVLPILGLIALLIKRDSKGPAFYTQKRLAQDGKEFKVYKFRTMYTQEIQDRLLADYLEENPQEIENYEIYAKYENDPRITKIGEFLRKRSLDELAQIINVIKGDMNFIGPRPYLISEKEKMGEESAKVILTVKPGITGLWQVSGRNELTFDERVELEKWYVHNWSLWKDFVIFNKTFLIVFNKVGAK